MSNLESFFYFMRHGQTDWNKKQLLMGQKNIPLNDTGRLQAKMAALKIKDRFEFKCIVTSPLLRSLETAQIVSEIVNVPYCINDNLKEAHFGLHEGLMRDASFLDHWMSGQFVPMEGEGFLEVKNRIEGVLSNILKSGESTLIISHGGVFLAILKLIGRDVDLLKNCQLVRIDSPSCHLKIRSV